MKLNTLNVAKIGSRGVQAFANQVKYPSGVCKLCVKISLTFVVLKVGVGGDGRCGGYLSFRPQWLSVSGVKMTFTIVVIMKLLLRADSRRTTALFFCH